MDRIEPSTIRTRGEPFSVKPYSSNNLIVAIVLTVIFLVTATVTMQMINSSYQTAQQKPAAPSQQQTAE